MTKLDEVLEPPEPPNVKHHVYYTPVTGAFVAEIIGAWRKDSFLPQSLSSSSVGISPIMLYQKFHYGLAWLAENTTENDGVRAFFKDVRSRLKIRRTSFGIDILLSNPANMMTRREDPVFTGLKVDFEQWVSTTTVAGAKWPVGSYKIALTDAHIAWFRARSIALLNEGFTHAARIDSEILYFVKTPSRLDVHAP